MKCIAIISYLCALLAISPSAFGAPRGKNSTPRTQATPSSACRQPTADCPCLFQRAAVDRDSVSYTLKIHLPPNVELTQPWTGFYQGQPIQFDGPSFVWALLPEHASYEHALSNHGSHGDESSGIFSLVITAQVTFMAEGNTIKWLQRIKGQPFRWFDITLNPLLEDGRPLWIVKELPKDQAPLQLPDHAITLLLDPRHVTGLGEPQKPCAKTAISSRFIALPTINITATDEDELNDACVQAALGAVDLRTIHQKKPLQVRQSQKAIMSLASEPV